MRLTKFWATLLCGAAYASVGLVFGALAANASSPELRALWRWAAWVLSAAAFGAHIVYEQRTLRNTPQISALHVASAAALGAFALAVAANVHRLQSRATTANGHGLALGLSLVIWPAMIMLPAYIVARIATSSLARSARFMSRSGSSWNSGAPG